MVSGSSQLSPLSFQEKMHGRNKLVPRLLGITRESIIRVDETTKEVLKTWPLTTVRCWGASPNAFTLVRREKGGRQGVCIGHSYDDTVV